MLPSDSAPKRIFLLSPANIAGIQEGAATLADEKNREHQSGKQKEQSQQKQNNPFSEQEKHGDEQQRRAPGPEREYQGDQSRQRRAPGVGEDDQEGERKRA